MSCSERPQTFQERRVRCKAGPRAGVWACKWSGALSRRSRTIRPTPLGSNHSISQTLTSSPRLLALASSQLTLSILRVFFSRP